MLRELLYPRAMAGPSLPGHPPQTPNNARCPPQPPSAYILVRGASLMRFTRMCRVFILIRILPQARTTSYKFWGVFQRVSS